MKKARGTADMQAGLATAQVSVGINNNQAKALDAKASGEAAYVRLTGEAEAGKISAVAATATSWAGTCPGTRHRIPSARSWPGARSACSTSTPIGEIPSLGVGFRVHAGATEKVRLDVDVAFALYLEEIATLDEQRTYLGAPVQEKTTTGTGDGAGGDTVPSAAQTADGDNGQGDGQPTDMAATRSTGSAASDSNVASGSGRGTTRSRRERKTRLLGAWHRHDISVPKFSIEVSLDGSVETVTDPIAGPVRSVIDGHYAQPNAMRPFTTKRNELPRAALAEEAGFRAAVAAALDMTWQPAYPDLELTAFAQPLGDDEYLISVSLRNATQLTGRALQDLSAYDCQLTVLPDAMTPLVAQRFDLAPDDYRLADLADVVGHGTGCVAVPTEAGGIRSETLPTFTQPVIEPRDDHVVAPRWTDLARDPAPILTSIQVAMEDFERDFMKFVDQAADQPHHHDAQKDPGDQLHGGEGRYRG